MEQPRLTLSTDMLCFGLRVATRWSRRKKNKHRDEGSNIGIWIERRKKNCIKTRSVIEARPLHFSFFAESKKLSRLLIIQWLPPLGASPMPLRHRWNWLFKGLLETLVIVDFPSRAEDESWTIIDRTAQPRENHRSMMAHQHRQRMAQRAMLREEIISAISSIEGTRRITRRTTCNNWRWCKWTAPFICSFS